MVINAESLAAVERERERERENTFVIDIGLVYLHTYNGSLIKRLQNSNLVLAYKKILKSKYKLRKHVKDVILAFLCFCKLSKGKYAVV